MLHVNNTLSVKRTISISILVFINFLFAFKYLDRVMPFALIPALLMLCFYVVIWKYRQIFVIETKHFNLITFSVIAVFIGLSLVIFKKFPLDTLNVDRWSVITSFWEAYFNGDYVYYSKSYAGNPPGAMPFYFILALPFYITGELGLMPIFGLIIFLVILSKSGISRNDFLWSLVFLVSSFFFLWEIPTRSNLFLNSTLFLGLLVLVNRIDNENFGVRFFLTAMLTGLILSTRFVLVIPIIVLFMWLLRSKGMSLQKMILFGIVALISFIITYLPFAINHIDDFLKMNPFFLQSTLFIPFYYIIAFILMAFASSFFCRNKQDVFFYSGLTLFVSIAVYFIYHIVVFGFERAYLGSIIDISYFIFCTPFLIYYLVGENVEKKQVRTHIQS